MCPVNLLPMRPVYTLSEGVPESEILEDYPYLEDDDIRASLAYAASQSDHPILKTQ